MQSKPALAALVVALERSLWQLEAYETRSGGTEAHPILLRRRRAVFRLRAVTRWQGAAMRRVDVRVVERPGTEIDDLIATERTLITLYARALTEATDPASQTVLRSQKSETEQALLTLISPRRRNADGTGDPGTADA